MQVCTFLRRTQQDSGTAVVLLLSCAVFSKIIKIALHGGGVDGNSGVFRFWSEERVKSCLGRTGKKGMVWIFGKREATRAAEMVC